MPALDFLWHTTLISSSVFVGRAMLVDLYNINKRLWVRLTPCDSRYDSGTRTQDHFCDSPTEIMWPQSNHEETPNSSSKGPFHTMNDLWPSQKASQENQRKTKTMFWRNGEERAFQFCVVLTGTASWMWIFLSSWRREWNSYKRWMSPGWIFRLQPYRCSDFEDWTEAT